MNERIQDRKGFAEEVKVPKDACGGAQTQRAIENFPVGGIAFAPVCIRTPGVIKYACANVIHEFHPLESRVVDAIFRSCNVVIGGKFKITPRTAAQAR